MITRLWRKKSVDSSGSYQPEVILIWLARDYVRYLLHPKHAGYPAPMLNVLNFHVNHCHFITTLLARGDSDWRQRWMQTDWPIRLEQLEIIKARGKKEQYNFLRQSKRLRLFVKRHRTILSRSYDTIETDLNVCILQAQLLAVVLRSTL